MTSTSTMASYAQLFVSDCHQRPKGKAAQRESIASSGGRVLVTRHEMFLAPLLLGRSEMGPRHTTPATRASFLRAWHCKVLAVGRVFHFSATRLMTEWQRIPRSA